MEWPKLDKWKEGGMNELMCTHPLIIKLAMPLIFVPTFLKSVL